MIYLTTPIPARNHTRCRSVIVLVNSFHYDYETFQMNSNFSHGNRQLKCACVKHQKPLIETSSQINTSEL